MTVSTIIHNELYCTGCGACLNICSKNAITWKEDNCGFKYPVINEELCVHCGLCKKVCLKPTGNENKANPKCYAVMCSDETRVKSTSSGVFKTLADWFLKNGGYISGAVFAEDWSVKHIVSNKAEDIEYMRGSKYVQSDMKYCYKEIEALLEEGKKVLFSGTPCQVAGLKKYLNKDYENLFCLDLICHGVPSAKIFQKYLNENFNINEIHDFKFRDKSFNGWNDKYCVTLNGELIANNDYLKNFLKNICLRESCYNCSHNKLPRQGDLTIGDFWGIEKYSTDMTDGLGTSVILENNAKGRFLLAILKKRCKKIKKMPLKKAVKHNPNICCPAKPHKDKDLYKKNFDNKADCMIINFWYALNYGASLTCYGTLCLTEKLGLNTKVINFVPEIFRKKYPESFSEKFANKYLNLTNPCHNYYDLLKLNKECNIFISGSDQIWNENIAKSHGCTLSTYMLDFVESGNKKLSYAASIGHSSFEDYTPEYLRLMRHFLPQFDSISVREHAVKTLLKNNFNIDSELLIDGAFHIPKDKLEEMAAQYPNKNGEYIALFMLGKFKNKKIIDKIAKLLNLPIKKWEFKENKDVEEWLSFIKNAKFVITNSFHGTSFSIIFNIPFVQIPDFLNTQSRFQTLFKILDIKSKPIKPNAADIGKDDLCLNYDWNSINSKITEECQRAEEWMRAALNTPVKKRHDDTLNYLIAKDGMTSSGSDNIASLNKDIRLLAQKEKIFRKYYRYKILSKILFGKKRKHYKQKRSKYKSYVRRIRELAV